MQGQQRQVKKDSAADFYGSLVSLDPSAPKWSNYEGGAGLGTAAAYPAPTAVPVLRPRVTKPVSFRSAGVHDLSALNANTILHPPTQAHGADGAQQQAPASTSELLAGVRGAAEGVVVVLPPGLQQQQQAGQGFAGGRRQLASSKQGEASRHPGSGGDEGPPLQGSTQQGDDDYDGGGSQPNGTAGARAHAGNPLTRGVPRSVAEAEAALEVQWRAVSAQWKASEKPKIPAGNIGYQLLKASGWKEGTGLGAQGQGRLAPIDPHKNPGTRGVGFDKGRPQKVAQHDPPAAKKAMDEAEAAAHAAKRARIAEIVEKEMAGETVAQKVAHHRAVISAKAAEARGRAIQRALYRALDDPLDSAGATTANSNPIGRRTRLTALNPLLNDEEGG